MKWYAGAFEDLPYIHHTSHYGPIRFYCTKVQDNEIKQDRPLDLVAVINTSTKECNLAHFILSFFLLE